MRKNLKLIIFGLFFLVILSGCSSNSSEPSDESHARLAFTPAEITVATGEQTSITLEILELSIPIFGLSFKMTFDPGIISFADTLEVESGNFFGQNTIAFATKTDSTIHLSFTKTQGQESVINPGIICSFPITGEKIGNCVIEILREEIRFYDSVGDEIEVLDLELGGMAVNVI